MRQHLLPDACWWILFAALFVETPACEEALASGEAPSFDFSKTHAARHLPRDYFERHVRNKEQYARWIAAHNELLRQLAPKKPISDEELFAEHVFLSFPGLEDTREAFEERNIAAARKAFAAFFLKRFSQKTPVRRGLSELTGWHRKVVGWCEGYLAGKIGPLRSSRVYYTLAQGEEFDFCTIDPVGFNNYDWCQISTWRQPIEHYLEGYAATGKRAYLAEAVRIINAWYDGFAGQARANYEQLTFDSKGQFRQGNLGHAAIEFTPWEHWAVAQGRLRRMLELAPFLSQTGDPEELAIRAAKMAAEDLQLLALRLPHYWGNFASYIGHDTCGLAVPFAFLRKAPQWFQLGFETVTKSYGTDSFPDGSTNDFTASYLLAYLRPYAMVQSIVDRYGEQNRFRLDREAFARAREKSFEWLLYTSMPDLSPPTFNDSWRPRGVGDVATWLRQLDWCGREDFRWFATERKGGAPPRCTSYPLRTHGPSWAGICAMRSDWRPDAVYLAVDFGPYGFNDAHGHADYGSFSIFAYGNDLVVDPACEVYGNPLHDKIDKAPQTHNTIMVDGVGQSMRSTPGRPQVFEKPIRTWVTNAVFDAAWGTYQFPTGLAHSRIVWFAKPDYFLVVDALSGEGRHEIRQNFTLAPFLNPVLEGNAARTVEPSKANILILPTDARPAPEIVKGRTEPMYEGWVCWNSDRIPSPAVVYSFDAEFPTGMETVLFPAPPGKRSDVRVTRKSAEGDTGAVLVTVTTPDAVDRFVISRSLGRHKFPDESIAFEGRMAAIRSVQGEARSIGVLGVKLLDVAGLEASAETPTDASLVLSRGQWTIGDGKGVIEVSAK